MSVTFDILIDTIESSLKSVGIDLTMTTSAPVQANSRKATSGSGSKVVATIRSLNVGRFGTSSDRGDQLTTGSVTLVLKPSKASTDVSLKAMGALLELGHRAITKLDGTCDIRAWVTSHTATASEVTVTAALGFGGIVPSKDTHDDLLGRV